MVVQSFNALKEWSVKMCHLQVLVLIVDHVLLVLLETEKTNAMVL